MRHITLIISVFVLLATALEATARPKTDIVVLKDGDIVTCEIKELVRGKLQVKTDAMSTVYIEWDKIDSLQSGYYYRVETSDGYRYFGSLVMESGTDELRIKSASRLAILAAENVVEITPLERSFWQRNNGSVSLGFSYEKSTDIMETALEWKNAYRTERNLIGLKLEATLKEQTDNETRRAIVGIDFTRLLRGKWTGTISTSVERADELDLARRFLGSITTGVTPINSNSNVLLLSAGFAFNSELATGGTVTTESMEWALTASYSMFYYNTPKTRIDIKLDAFPSITEEDRYRIKFDTTLSREIISDLFFDLTYFLDYDSNTASGEGEKRDYGIKTSVGYSY